MVGSNKKQLLFIEGPGCFLLRAGTTQSRFSIRGQKLGRPLINKKNDFHEVFYSGFPLPNGKQQKPKGAAREARRPFGAAPQAPPCCFSFDSGSPEYKT